MRKMSETRGGNAEINRAAAHQPMDRMKTKGNMNPGPGDTGRAKMEEAFGSNPGRGVDNTLRAAMRHVSDPGMGQKLPGRMDRKS